MQLQKTVMDYSVIPLIQDVGYAQPAFDVLSCANCNNGTECLAKQMPQQIHLTHNQSYQVVKSRHILSSGEHIYRGWDDAQAIYILRSGSVKSYMLMEDGEEQILDFYMPGNVFGLDAMGIRLICLQPLHLKTQVFVSCH